MTLSLISTLQITKSSHSAFTSRYLVTTLNNAMFSLDVSWKRILAINILQLPLSRHYCPANIPQLNCSADCLQNNSSARITQKHNLSVVQVCLPRRCIAMVAARTTFKNRSSIVACVIYQRPLSTESLLSNGSIRHNIKTYKNGGPWEPHTASLVPDTRHFPQKVS
jgi:hypothetical protein